MYKDMTFNELKALDPDTLPVVDMLIVKRLMEDVKRKNTTELHRMYNRQLGAPKQDAEEPAGFDLTGAKVVIRVVGGPNQ